MNTPVKPVARIARVVMATALVAATLVLGACNTVKGAGEDLQQASENTEKVIKGGK